MQYAQLHESLTIVIIRPEVNYTTEQLIKQL